MRYIAQAQYDISSIRYVRFADVNRKTKHFEAPIKKCALKHSPPLAGGTGWAVSTRTKDFAPKRNQGRNTIKSKRIRRGGFFPLRSAVRNISHHEVIYRIRRIYRAEGISCALRARGEGAKTSRKREVLLLPNSRRGVVCLKRREYFDRCGGRLKALP